MKNLLILLGLIFLTYGCKKDKITTYTIKGHISNCNNGLLVPALTNTGIDLFQQKNGSNNNSKILSNTSTDAQGNFTFTYSTDNDYDKLIIRTSSGFGFSRLMENIPLGNLKNLKVINPRYNLVVGLNVIKPYTSFDTIRILKPDSNIVKKITGPFNTGRVFVSKNVLLTETLKYGLNKAILQVGLNTFVNIDKEYFLEDSKLCGDTVFVTIDIR